MITRAGFFNSVVGFFAACAAGLATGGEPVARGVVTVKIDARQAEEMLRNALAKIQADRKIAPSGVLGKLEKDTEYMRDANGMRHRIVNIRCTMAETKPVRRNSGIWKSQEPTGLVATADDGSLWWHEGFESDHWEML